MKYARLQKFENVERHQGGRNIWAMPDKKFIGKPEISLNFLFYKANSSSVFEVFRTLCAHTTLALEACLASWSRKNGNHHLNSFPCHTIHPTASKCRSYLNDWDTCRKCKCLLLRSYHVSFLQNSQYCYRAWWLSVLLQPHGAECWADQGSGATPGMEPPMNSLCRR